VNTDDPFERKLAEGWQDYGFLTPDEMIAARQAYGGIKDEYNPLLRGRRRIQRQSSGGGAFILGAIVGYFFGRDSHC
jgi:hypothetical protein